MVNLLESKLNSLPSEITSKYPESANITFINNQANIPIPSEVVPNQESREQQISQPDQIKEEEKQEVDDTPQGQLQKFLDENRSDELESFVKMLKYGISEGSLIQKAKLTSFDVDIVTVCSINLRL